MKTDNEGNVHLSLQQGSDPVSATSSFIQWTLTGNQAEVQVHIAIMCFLPYCTLSEDVKSSDACISCIMFNLSEDAWSRILNTLTEAGAFNTCLKDEHELSVKLASVDLSSEPMTITMDDLQLGDTFDYDPGSAAGSGGRSRRGNTPQTAEEAAVEPGPADLRFLALVGVHELVQTRGPKLSPLVRLIGMLGPCLARSSRSGEMSGVRIMAAILMQGINTFLGGDGKHPYDHPVLAASLCEFLVATELPWMLRAPGLSMGSLRAEARDGAR